VGEGQKQTRCRASPVRRRGDAECSDYRGVSHQINAPLPLTQRTGPSGPTTALRVRNDGVLASPWMWAKARSKLGAMLRLCKDGAMPNVAITGVFRIERMLNAPLPLTHRIGPSGPTTALRVRKDGVVC
jgi:hypothetical protein